ncbi:hypothetical protein [Ruegeria hyattellae]|uniref:hypothetical protein n=1 Tax=Ruegeria hyattellae TaxID=3233337 RepID=UPI00355AD830
MRLANAALQEGENNGRILAQRYRRRTGRCARLVTVSIGLSTSDSVRVRALVAFASGIGMPLDQQLCGQNMPQEGCRDLVQQLNRSEDVFAVLLLPDVPDHIDTRALRADLCAYKDLTRLGAWHHAGPVRPGEIDGLAESAIASHQAHLAAMSPAQTQSAR